ncbi:chromodomain helicase DNA binding protein 7 [Homo sapiens]|uniref:CHD7 isoform 3 n=3 Tax=Hominidae TaxID=9604 RepID=A0A2J8UQW4_PONAB|nr:chromodomain-helicase-DNA-binding protein 7 isoform 2 [Homo sapiens]KAI2550100.1 chromodomain helicase DNA binding protein 7 [Homo sapiens]KAI4010743.1 chromodomain helicase DNA binding protein 7 [Homo sapiens]PNJ47665.1 CHD7 isoform 3 [Pongo abelii]|eukprot:NP_001303619.1 chromodomain-helicase-DNA-binding protein 7 isoform 2 [Homo sapiens]
MADPGMMSLFGEDGNIFSEGLEGLGECGYPENPVNPMGQQMPIDQGFASLQPSLHHPSTNQNQTKLTHFDHYNQYEQQKMHLMDQPNRMMSNTPGNGLASPHSQYHTPPVPQVPHGGSGGGQMGVYPGMQNERHGQSFVDSSSMWGPRAVQVPDQIRAPYQQQQPQPQPPQPAPSGPPAQGHPQHMQQMGSYMARGDFSMQQHGQPQQRMSQFSQGQEGLNQGNPFIATSGPGHLSHVPQQSPSMAPSLRHSVQQFHHHPSTALHGESVAHSPRFSPNPPQQGAVRPQTLNFSSRSQTVPSPTINNSGQYSRYPYSNLNQGLVNNTGMNQNLGLTNNTPMNQSVPRYPNAVGFPSNSGQGLMHQQPIHPSGSLNQMNTQTMHPSQPQGTYASPPPMSPMKAMSNPAGTPPPQVRPGSAGIPMEVGSYPNMPHPQPSHQPPGAMGIGQRNMGPRNMQQSRPFIGMSSAPRELTGHMRPNGCPGVGLGDPQAIQERLIPGQQHPGQQPSFQQLPTCPPLQPHPGLHHQSSPPHPHHQPWAQLHPSPQNTPQKVPVHQHSPSEPFLEKPVPDMTQKPKQKRHRCRNPNKLDINTLTGEERVPVVNKRNGKKMGGAMAPPMKDLPRWLEENPEFAVAPDWTDIVKQSGFVPESMFDRLLTGPVVRGEGASRRGRRPKSEIARAAAAAAAVASTSGINPLLVNSLFAGMDLTSLQNLQNLQSLQLAGLMGFPPGLATAATAGGDAKNPAAVLPLMLPGMAGLPNVFGLGGLLNNPLSAATGNTTTASSQGEPEDSTSKGEEKGNENEDENKDSEKSTDAVSAADSANGSVGAATAPAGLPSNPLAFNPFLLSTMAPGLFYPSMFLPPGLGGLTLPGFPALAGLQNAVGSSEEKAADKAEGGPFKDGETLEGSDAEESLDKTAESSLLEDEIAQGEELDSLDGGDEIENNENDE